MIMHALTVGEQHQDSNTIEGTLQKGATTLPDCRGYLEVDYGGNSQESKLDCIGELSALIYAQGV